MKKNGSQQPVERRNGSQQTAERPRKIESEELFVVWETQPDQKGRFQKIRVVRWIIDAVKGSAKLEKRGFYPGSKGDVLTGDAPLGLDLDDVKRLAEQMPHILEVMQEGQFAA